MSRNQLIKLLANSSLALAFICACGLLLNKTYGHADLARNCFYIFGGSGLIFNVYVSAVIEKEKEFNWIFWIGTLVIFSAVVIKTLYLSNYQIVLFVGAGITGISYFFNPFSKNDDEEEDTLLDQ